MKNMLFALVFVVLFIGLFLIAALSRSFQIEMWVGLGALLACISYPIYLTIKSLKDAKT